MGGDPAIIFPLFGWRLNLASVLKKLRNFSKISFPFVDELYFAKNAKTTLATSGANVFNYLPQPQLAESKLKK